MLIFYGMALYQITKKFSGLKNTNVLSYNSVGQESDTGPTGLKSRCQDSAFTWKL